MNNNTNISELFFYGPPDFLLHHFDLEAEADSKMSAAKSDPKGMLAIQSTASLASLSIYAGIMLFHCMGLRATLAYAGLVLPHHVNGTSALLHLSVEESTWFAAITPIASTIGSLVSGPLTEPLGLKRLLMISNLSASIGSLAIFFAPSFPVLILSRLFQCIGIGLGATTAIVYTNEMSTIKTRGPIVGGCLTSMVVATLGYTALCIILPIQWLSLVLVGHHALIFLLQLLLPNTPQWLVRKSREDEAYQSLKKLRGQKYEGIDAEVEEIKQVIEARASFAQTSTVNALKDRTFKMPLAILCCIFVIEACAGQETFLYYGPTIFSKIDIGLPSSFLATIPWFGLAIGFASSSLVMARFEIQRKRKNIKVFNRMPRVGQFVGFTSAVAVGMFTLGAMLLLLSKGSGDPTVEAIVLVASLILANVAMALGAGSVPYTLMGELLPPEYKALGGCVVMTARFVYFNTCDHSQYQQYCMTNCKIGNC